MEPQSLTGRRLLISLVGLRFDQLCGVLIGRVLVVERLGAGLPVGSNPSIADGHVEAGDITAL